MLKSSGFFASVHCPFFDSGLCERPYCHFKHAVKAPTYVPTPLSSSFSASKPESSIKRKPFAKSNVPVYTPTPISQLKKLKERKYSETSVASSPEKSNDDESKYKETSLKSGNGDVEKKEKTDDVNRLHKKKKTSSSDEKETQSANEEICDTEESIDPDVTADVIERSAVKNDDPFAIPTKKARIAHKQSESLPSKTMLPRKNRLSATQVMINRMTSVNKPVEISETFSTSSSGTSIGGKRRIAHNLKPMATYSKAESNASNTSPTKDNPIEEVKRPTLPLELGGKVPLIVRQKCLNSFIDEYLKIHPDCKKTAFDRALEEERNVFKRSSRKHIYLNLAANKIKSIRAENATKKDLSPKKEQNGLSLKRMISHEAVLNGPLAAGCSIEKRHVSLTVKDIDDDTLYSIMKRFVLSNEDLKKYGYPLRNEEKKDEVIYPLPENKIKNNFISSRRTCCRCHKVFQVNEAGVPVKKEECVYHCGRLWKERGNGFIDRKYSCCKGDASSDGCCFATSHVPDGYGHPLLMKGYVSSPISNDDKFPGIYALDCEMCYTTIGLELTRISVIDHHSKCVYESLVKPKNPILDYNTKFSGIKENDLISVNVTLEDVHKKLFSFINNKTILIGHSLDSDFKAIKLLHESVVDTAAVFPHKAGLPLRRALKTITAEFLKKIIQDEISGHDSQEDAMSCMELMLYKVGQELSKMKKVS